MRHVGLCVLGAFASAAAPRRASRDSSGIPPQGTHGAQQAVRRRDEAHRARQGLHPARSTSDVQRSGASRARRVDHHPQHLGASDRTDAAPLLHGQRERATRGHRARRQPLWWGGHPSRSVGRPSPPPAGRLLASRKNFDSRTLACGAEYGRSCQHSDGDDPCAERGSACHAPSNGVLVRSHGPRANGQRQAADEHHPCARDAERYRGSGMTFLSIHSDRQARSGRAELTGHVDASGRVVLRDVDVVAGPSRDRCRARELANRSAVSLAQDRLIRPRLG